MFFTFRIGAGLGLCKARNDAEAEDAKSKGGRNDAEAEDAKSKGGRNDAEAEDAKSKDGDGCLVRKNKFLINNNL